MSGSRARVLGLFLFLPAIVFGAERPSISANGQVFTGVDRNIAVEMVRIGPPSAHEVLIKIVGLDDDEIDGKVLKYGKEPANGGYNYRKSGYVRITERKSTGGKGVLVEVYSQNKSYKVAYDKKKSEALRTEKLLTDYLENTPP